MFDVKDHICVPGKTVCEDAIGWGKTYLFALDGASGLTGSHIMDGGSDAAWFAAGVRDRLCEALDQNDQRPVAAILEEILADLRKVYQGRADHLGVSLPPDSPSAGIALFREIGEEIEYWGLGDCVGMVRLIDGSVFWSCDAALPALDDGVVAHMVEIHRKTGITVLAARPQCNDLLLHNRTLKNTPDGYWILDLSGIGLAHARVQRWRREEVESVSACSDGFGQLVSPFHLVEDYGKLHDRIMEKSLKELTAALFAAQERDLDANCYPRLKFRDDVCALWAQTSN